MADNATTVPRNVLFITADQWRGDCLSVLGHLVQTPNLDALAGDGVLFTNHFANTAPCGPSRASIHTGMRQHRHGVTANGVPLASRHTNWALEARKLGHTPVLFGYTDTTPEGIDPAEAARNISDGILPGVDPIVHHGKSIWRPTAWAAWLREKGYPVPTELIELFTATTGETRDNCPAPLRLPAELHDTAFLVDQTIEYVKKHSAWCVHLSIFRPHPPWVAPAPYNALYPPDELPPFTRADTPEAEGEAHPWLAHTLNQKLARAPANEAWYGQEGGLARMRRWQASYFGLITEVDHNLGRLFDALKETGAWQDTLIVFTSDHGEQMGDHWLVGKMGFFDESYAVPLIVRNPDRAADGHRGVHIDAFTESIDLMPTLLDWLGAPTPRQCDGASLLPATTIGSLEDGWRDAVRWEYHFAHAAESLGLSASDCRLNVTRGRDYKEVVFPEYPALLYDLRNDPHQMHARRTATV